MFSRSIQRMVMNDGTSVEVGPGGVVVFVGPNNAGKSQALRNLTTHFSQGRQDHEVNVVAEVEWRRDGDEADFREWLGAHATFNPKSQQWHKGTTAAHVSWISQVVGGPPLHHWWEFFMYYAGGEGRLSAAHPAPMINFVTDTPVHPLHSMYMDDKLEAEISAICRRVFGVGLVLNRYAGSMVSLHVGDAPTSRLGVNSAPTKEYLAELSGLPQLSEQGDGMRSFMGLSLFTMTASYFTVVVDEPEAFLHPPQAYILGQILVGEKSGQTQVIMATHSSDILRGILDADSDDVTIVRLSRDGASNRSAVLAAGEVKKLWKDPLLRYSNILDGLFHDGVVVCEGDVDCRFYSTIADQLQVDGRRQQLLYTHCGGKGRMPQVIDSLSAVGVPTRAIADFDVFQDVGELQRIVTSLGGDWSAVEADAKTVQSAIDQQGGSLDVTFARQELARIFGGVQGAKLKANELEKLRAVLKAPSGWPNAKNAGVQAVPSGDASAALERLLSDLANVGLFVVPVGEVERFVPAVGGHGPKWLAGVFEAGHHSNIAMTDKAREFVAKVVGSFA